MITFFVPFTVVNSRASKDDSYTRISGVQRGDTPCFLISGSTDNEDNNVLRSIAACRAIQEWVTCFFEPHLE